MPTTPRTPCAEIAAVQTRITTLAMLWSPTLNSTLTTPDAEVRGRRMYDYCFLLTQPVSQPTTNMKILGLTCSRQLQLRTAVCQSNAGATMFGTHLHRESRNKAAQKQSSCLGAGLADRLKVVSASWLEQLLHFCLTVVFDMRTLYVEANAAHHA